MALTWRIRRKLFYLGFFSLFAIAVVFGFILIFKPSPSCFDGVQNQKEEGVDCGGPCLTCVKEVKEPIVLWTRFFKTSKENSYNLAGLVRNQNYNLGLGVLTYRFKLYDERNILIAVAEGKTFLNPADEMLIFEPNISANKRIPARAILELIPQNWKVDENRFLRAIHLKDKKFLDEDFSKVEVIFENQNIFPVEGIQAQIVLIDENGNAYEASKTVIERIEGENLKKIVFSWPRRLKEPAAIDVYWQKMPPF